MKSLYLSDRLSFLEAAFVNFERNIVSYGDLFKWKALPYFINERATLSLFHGACCQAGLVSIEEFVTKKYDEDQAKYGRCDLYVSPKVGPYDVEFEAKQKWPTRLSEGLVAEWLQEGHSDALRNRDAIIQASITFVVPRFKLHSNVEQYRETAEFIVNSALDFGIDGFHVWSSRESHEHKSKPRFGEGKCRWPFVVTLIRIANVKGEKRSIKKMRLPKEVVVF
jgi:hypothetical protein